MGFAPRKLDMDLLEQISEKPDAIEEFTREQLEEVRAKLIEAGRSYTAAIKSGESEDKKADLEAAKEAKERLEAVNTRLAEFEAEDKELSDAAAELDDVFGEDEEAVEDDELKAEEEEPEVEEPVAEEEEPTEEPEVVEIEKETQPIAASDEPKAKPSVGAIAKRAPKQKLPEKALVANAGPSLPTRFGESFRAPEEVADAMAYAWKNAASGQQVLVAAFPHEDQYKYELKHDAEHDTAMISQAIRDYKRGLEIGDVLTAAGPCAPAQPVYDFFSIVETAGMVMMPTVSAPRGGLIYPQSSSYATVRDTAAWSAAAGQQTETSKQKYQVTCPSTTECTVVPFPLILEFTNMQQRFYPEFISHSLATSVAFHDHFVNATHIASMVTASTAQGGGDTGGGGLVNVANLVGFEAMKYRDNYRMSPTATLELVIPAWVIDALVADLVARNATVDFGNARARVQAAFASLNLNVQAVQDWQSSADAADGGWRTAADFLLFAPGTFVRLDGGSLNLGVVRDSTLNADNEFQIFQETFEVVCEVGHDSWLLDDVTVCPRGIAAADATLDCNPGFGS